MAGELSDEVCIAGTRCPYCKAAKGSPCVYKRPDSRWYTEEQLRKWPGLREQFRRAGKPTKQVHPQRRDIMRRRQWVSYVKAHKGPVVPISADYMDAWRAQLAFDQRENEQLRRFFLAWGDMFQSSNDIDKPTGRV